MNKFLLYFFIVYGVFSMNIFASEASSEVRVSGVEVGDFEVGSEIVRVSKLNDDEIQLLKKIFGIFIKNSENEAKLSQVLLDIMIDYYSKDRNEHNKPTFHKDMNGHVKRFCANSKHQIFNKIIHGFLRLPFNIAFIQADIEVYLKRGLIEINPNHKNEFYLTPKLVDKLCYCNVTKIMNERDKVEKEKAQIIADLWYFYFRDSKLESKKMRLLSEPITIPITESSCCGTKKKTIIITKTINDYLNELGLSSDNIDDEQLILIYLLIINQNDHVGKNKKRHQIDFICSLCEERGHQYQRSIVDLWYYMENPVDSRSHFCLCKVLNPDSGYLSLTQKNGKKLKDLETLTSATFVEPENEQEVQKNGICSSCIVQ